MRSPNSGGPTATACGGSGADAEGTFAYDADAPLAVEDGDRLESDSLDVREISYSSGDQRVEGVRVALPSLSDPVPGVVYLHGSGGDRGSGGQGKRE